MNTALRQQSADADLAALADRGVTRLAGTDPDLYRLLTDDLLRQSHTLSLLASAAFAPPAVLACAGAPITNVTTHGYPGSRPGGDGPFDALEWLAVERAKAAFGARYANVQPHSSSAANLAVYLGLLRPGDTIMALDSAWGNRSTHGSPMSVTGRLFRTVPYSLNGIGRIDYERVRLLAARCRPRLLVCSAGSCPRTPDYDRFRAIADEVGAFLLADISPVAALVAAGAHANPVDVAHVTTCGTSMLGGPRGGLILLGKEVDRPVGDGADTLRRVMQTAVYPLTQGAPNAAVIAAKAAALRQVRTPDFRQVARRAIADAMALATHLQAAGHDIVANGTDNHSLLLNVMADGATGLVAERALSDCGLLVSRNRVPFDVKPEQLGSGIRLGTQALAGRGMGPRDMATVAALVDDVLRAVVPHSDTAYALSRPVQQRVRDTVRQLCVRFPIPDYPAVPKQTRHRLSAA